MRLLLRLPHPDVLLVQTPPAAPTLLIAWAVGRVRGSRLVVDWHNFGYTVLALRLGARNPVVAIAAWYERFVGRLADHALCVSRAMRDLLSKQWRVADPVVLYDLPTERMALSRLNDGARAVCRRELISRLIPREEMRRWADGALIVCPTSWTADDDFTLLIDALRHRDQAVGANAAGVAWSTARAARERGEGEQHNDGDAIASASSRKVHPRKLLVLCTGRGPLRKEFEQRIASLRLEHAVVRTAWFSHEDYRRLLRTADLGLCLHRSSSGLDLPIKLLDLFAAGTPACALDYGPCLTERLKNGKSFLLFNDSLELALQLERLFDRGSSSLVLLERLRRGAASESAILWEEQWRQIAWPILGNENADSRDVDTLRKSA
jgi:beta-1,4-mannosyltransferase